MNQFRHAARLRLVFTTVNSQGIGRMHQNNNSAALVGLVKKRFSNSIVDGNSGTHKPTEFQKRLMVMAKMYPSVDKVPSRVSRTQIRNSMDKFRVRVSISMVALTLVFAAIMAMIGKKQRNEGLTVSKIAMQKYGKSE